MRLLLALLLLPGLALAQTTVTGTLTGIGGDGWQGTVKISASNRCTPSGGGIVALSSITVDMSASTDGSFEHADGTAVTLMPTDVCTETGTHYDFTYNGRGDLDWDEECEIASAGPVTLEASCSITAQPTATTLPLSKITGATDDNLICGNSVGLQDCTGLTQLGTANVAQQIIQAGSAQSTNDLLQVQNNAGTKISAINASGYFDTLSSGTKKSSHGSNFLQGASDFGLQFQDNADLALGTTDICITRAEAGILRLSDDCSTNEYFRLDGSGTYPTISNGAGANDTQLQFRTDQPLLYIRSGDTTQFGKLGFAGGDILWNAASTKLNFRFLEYVSSGVFSQRWTHALEADDSYSLYDDVAAQNVMTIVTGSGPVFPQGLAIAASGYGNWGATQGTTGYGLRDNAGQMEFKHSGGSWAELDGGGGAAPGVSNIQEFPFSAVDTVTITNAQHNCNTVSMLVQVRDDQSPEAYEIPPVTAHPTTFEVQVLYPTGSSHAGTVYLDCNPLNYTEQVSGTTWSIPAANHGYDTSSMLVQVWSNDTPRQLILAPVTVNASTLEVAGDFSGLNLTAHPVIGGNAGTGGGGGGATMGSQLGDFEVTRTSSTVLTIGANCAPATPCNYQDDDTAYQVTAPMTATISAGSATAYVYADGATIYVGTNGDTVVCAGCTHDPAVSAFPGGSVIFATWTASSGTWVDAGGADLRSLYNASSYVAGTAISIAGRVISVDTAAVGLRVAVPATASSACNVGEWAMGTGGDNNFYWCKAANTWLRVLGATW